MKKVLIDLLKLSNINCGLGQVALNFASVLAKTNTNFEKHYLVPDNFVNYFGEQIHYHTKKTIKKQKFDLWHSIHQQPDILPENDTKFILTIHDFNFLWEKNKIKASSRIKKLQKLVDVADYITFISNYSKQTAICNLHHLDINNTKVIYNGVLVKKNDNLQNKKAPFLFSIGVFKPKKNFHSLIYTMKYLPEYKLVIAGDNKGKYYKKLKRITKKLNLTDKIIYTGKISEEKKYEYYSQCIAFVFPSLYEGFGLPIIEAMHYNCPVIISDKTSLPEIGKDFAYYFINFDPQYMAEKIKFSIQDFYAGNKNYLEQKKYAESFSWQNNVNQYIKIYEKLL